jgi:hypothetical protein
MNLRRWIGSGITILLAVILLERSALPPGDLVERIRAYTRLVEFDYVAWSLQAIGDKLTQFALGASDYLPLEADRRLVLEYLELVGDLQRADAHLETIYSDPQVQNPEVASRLVRQQLASLSARRARLGPLAEAVFQSQLSAVLADLGFTLGGQPLPPVLYRTTPLPAALIVSPRQVIRQEANISLPPDLTLDERVALENQVDKALDVSSLVEDIGGIGTYPTMVMQTDNLNYLAEVVAHEWIHNYLTLRPLGLNYLASAELRTMNETTASIAGKEIGQALVARFYPEFLPPPPPPPPEQPLAGEPAPPAFDFRAEMRVTRVRVDELLAAGQVEAAEVYMEERRVFFWEHGYQIRKLNQAYFAFHGAYADQPGGAAGADPVGAAVRALRASSTSLVAFVNRMAWITSFEKLQEIVTSAANGEAPLPSS